MWIEILHEAFSVIAAIVGFAGVSFSLKRQTQDIEDSRKDIEEAESRVESQPEKTKPAWDLARATLDAYFNRNLSQITWIFWLSVFVMFAGFMIIGWGLSQAVNNPKALGPSTIAAAAGVITEFIGATFLFIYRSTIEQASNYAKALERINSVGMAMQILDTMPDEAKLDDLKSKTKATLVELLVRQSYELSAMPQEKPSIPSLPSIAPKPAESTE